MRPLQMVHGIDLTIRNREFIPRIGADLGGLVVNVGGAGYIVNDENGNGSSTGFRVGPRPGCVSDL